MDRHILLYIHLLNVNIICYRFPFTFIYYSGKVKGAKCSAEAKPLSMRLQEVELSKRQS